MNALKALGRQSLLAALLGGVALLQVAQAGTITSVSVAAIKSDGSTLASQTISGSLYGLSHDLATGPYHLEAGLDNINGTNAAEIDHWLITLGGSFDPGKQLQISGEVIGKYPVALGGTTFQWPFQDYTLSPATTNSFTITSNNVSSGFYPINSTKLTLDVSEITPVPIPATAVLFGSGLVGLLGFGQAARRRKDDSVAA